MILTYLNCHHHHQKVKEEPTLNTTVIFFIIKLLQNFGYQVHYQVHLPVFTLTSKLALHLKEAL